MTETTAQFKKLKEGEILSEQQFYVVAKKTGTQVQLTNDHGENIVVDAKYVDQCLTSAAQAISEEKLTRTELAAKFLANPNIAMSMSFNKKVKEVDLVAEIMTSYEGSTPSAFKTGLKKTIKKGMSGEERIIEGRHYGEMNEFGRVNFVDMKQTKKDGAAYDTRLRQVDPRTINWMILKGIKYTVK